jgi:hypothetical protein
LYFSKSRGRIGENEKESSKMVTSVKNEGLVRMHERFFATKDNNYWFIKDSDIDINEGVWEIYRESGRFVGRAKKLHDAIDIMRKDRAGDSQCYMKVMKR